MRATLDEGATMTSKDQDIDAVRQKMESARESIFRLPNVVGIGVGRKRSERS